MAIVPFYQALKALREIETLWDKGIASDAEMLLAIIHYETAISKEDDVSPHILILARLADKMQRTKTA